VFVADAMDATCGWTQPLEQLCQHGTGVVAICPGGRGLPSSASGKKNLCRARYLGEHDSDSRPSIDIIQRQHPAVVDVKPFYSNGSLPKCAIDGRGATILLTGAIADHTEPVAWTHSFGDGRVFCTVLGQPDDMTEPSFLRLLVGAVFWSSGCAI
jgi:hypothetical protein